MEHPVTPARTGVGLRRVADLILNLITTGPKLETTTHYKMTPVDSLEIAQSSKEEEAVRHK